MTCYCWRSSPTKLLVVLVFRPPSSRKMRARLISLSSSITRHWDQLLCEVGILNRRVGVRNWLVLFLAWAILRGIVIQSQILFLGPNQKAQFWTGSIQFQIWANPILNPISKTDLSLDLSPLFLSLAGMLKRIEFGLRVAFLDMTRQADTNMTRS